MMTFKAIYGSKVICFSYAKFYENLFLFGNKILFLNLFYYLKF